MAPWPIGVGSGEPTLQFCVFCRDIDPDDGSRGKDTISLWKTFSTVFFNTFPTAPLQFFLVTQWVGSVSGHHTQQIVFREGETDGPLITALEPTRFFIENRSMPATVATRVRIEDIDRPVTLIVQPLLNGMPFDHFPLHLHRRPSG